MSRNGPPKRGNRLVVSVMLDEDQVLAFDEIVWARRTTRSAVAREAIDLYLRENMHETPMHESAPSKDPAHATD